MSNALLAKLYILSIVLILAIVKDVPPSRCPPGQKYDPDVIAWTKPPPNLKKHPCQTWYEYYRWKITPEPNNDNVEDDHE